MAETQSHHLTDEQKAHYARLAREIEAEFPPDVPRRSPDPSLPGTLGDYFNLRALLCELRQLRKAQGISIDDMQARTGLPQDDLARLETGADINPTLNMLARYAHAVGRRISVTLEESTDKSG
jgi:hypothetical protein